MLCTHIWGRCSVLSFSDVFGTHRSIPGLSVHVTCHPEQPAHVSWHLWDPLHQSVAEQSHTVWKHPEVWKWFHLQTSLWSEATLTSGPLSRPTGQAVCTAWACRRPLWLAASLTPGHTGQVCLGRHCRTLKHREPKQSTKAVCHFPSLLKSCLQY